MEALALEKIIKVKLKNKLAHLANIHCTSFQSFYILLIPLITFPKESMEKKAQHIQQIQKYLAEHKELDGWLIYDFHAHNLLGLELLGISSDQLLTRRFFYWIPKKGSPLKIVNQIEAHVVKHLPGDQIAYESWQSLEMTLKSTLRGTRCIAMEHSPLGLIPVLAKLDAGLYQWLQAHKIEVVDSWPLAKHFTCQWDNAQLKAHKEASKFLLKTFTHCFELAHKKSHLTEYDLQQEILQKFLEAGVRTDHPPIVATGTNSALPHYSPTQKLSAPLEKESLLLLDMWCKKDRKFAPFADLTQVAYLGKKPPQKMVEVYAIVKAAQDEAIEFIQTSFAKGKEVMGCEVDDVCRQVIQKAGYGKYFVHRTGHNIHTMLHGLGPNLDNFETHDTRALLPRSCYSVEPGIYLPKAFGIRLECNIFIHETLKVEVTGRSPKELLCLY